jgi:hypothetical protein
MLLLHLQALARGTPQASVPSATLFLCNFANEWCELIGSLSGLEAWLTWGCSLHIPLRSMYDGIYTIIKLPWRMANCLQLASQAFLVCMKNKSFLFNIVKIYTSSLCNNLSNQLIYIFALLFFSYPVKVHKSLDLCIFLPQGDSSHRSSPQSGHANCDHKSGSEDTPKMLSTTGPGWRIKVYPPISWMGALWLAYATHGVCQWLWCRLFDCV